MAIETSGSIEGYTLRLGICHSHIGCEVVFEEGMLCPVCDMASTMARLEVESRHRPHRTTGACRPWTPYVGKED